MMPMMRTRPLRELTSTWVRGGGARGDRGMPPHGVTGHGPSWPAAHLPADVSCGVWREARESSAAAAEKC